MEPAPLEVTPIDLARHILPAPHDAQVQHVSVDGCLLTVEHGEAVPLEPDSPSCDALWSNELVSAMTRDAVTPARTTAWKYFFTRDHGPRETSYAVDMTYQGDRSLLMPRGGTLEGLTCHRGKRWELVQFETDGKAYRVSDGAVAKDLQRPVGCEAEVSVSGHPYRVPVHQELTAAALALDVLLLLLVAGPLSLVATALLRLAFRRRVLKTLSGGGETQPAPDEERTEAQTSELRFEPLRSSKFGPLATHTLQSLHRGVLVYAVACGVCAVALAVGTQAPQQGPRATLLLALGSIWLLVPTIAVTMPMRRGFIFAAAAGYAALYAGLAVALHVSPHAALKLWLSTQLVPLAAIAFVFISPLRRVGPWVFLAFWTTVAALHVPYLLFQGPAGSALAIATRLAVRVGISSAEAIVALSALLSLLFALPLLWLALRLLTQVHLRLRLSDRLVVAGSLWGLQTLVVVLMSVHNTSNRWVFGALAVPPLVVASMLFALRVRGTETPRRLLFLRSFEGRKGQIDVFRGLKDLLSQSMHIELIAGPDLALALVQPFELLDFVTGKLIRAYIHERTELDSRLRSEDSRRDSDGRYPVRQFFCANKIWKAVFAELASRAAVVLIDLRGLSEERAGCAYELTQLIRRVPLARIIVLIDEKTDRARVTAVASAAWSNLPASSPNLGMKAPSVAVFEHDPRRRGELQRLMGHICRVAET